MTPGASRRMRALIWQCGWSLDALAEIATCLGSRPAQGCYNLRYSARLSTQIRDIFRPRELALPIGGPTLAGTMLLRPVNGRVHKVNGECARANVAANETGFAAVCSSDLRRLSTPYTDLNDQQVAFHHRDCGARHGMRACRGSTRCCTFARTVPGPIGRRRRGIRRPTGLNGPPN